MTDQQLKAKRIADSIIKSAKAIKALLEKPKPAQTDGGEGVIIPK